MHSQHVAWCESAVRRHTSTVRLRDTINALQRYADASDARALPKPSELTLTTFFLRSRFPDVLGAPAECELSETIQCYAESNPATTKHFTPESKPKKRREEVGQEEPNVATRGGAKLLPFLAQTHRCETPVWAPHSRLGCTVVGRCSCVRAGGTRPLRDASQRICTPRGPR